MHNLKPLEEKMQKGFLVFAILLGFMLTAALVGATTTYTIVITFRDAADTTDIENIGAGQDFIIKAEITPAANATSVEAHLDLPYGFNLTSPITTSIFDQYHAHFYELEDSAWYNDAQDILTGGTPWPTYWNVTAPKETGTYEIAVRVTDNPTVEADAATDAGYSSARNTSSITVTNSTPLTVTEDRTRHGFGETVIISGSKATNAIVNVTIINPLGFISNKSSNSTDGTTWQVAYKLNETIDYEGIYDVEVLAENSTGDGFAYAETTFRVGNKSKRKFPHLEFFCTQCHERKFYNGSFYDKAGEYHPGYRAVASLNPDWVHSIHNPIPEFNDSRIATQDPLWDDADRPTNTPGKIMAYGELSRTGDLNKLRGYVGGDEATGWKDGFPMTLGCRECHLNIEFSAAAFGDADQPGVDMSFSGIMSCTGALGCHIATMKGAHKNRPSCVACHEEGGEKPSCEKCHVIDAEIESLEETGNIPDGTYTSENRTIRSEASYREKAYSEIRYKVDYTITDGPATGTNTLTLYYLAADDFYFYDTRTHSGSGSGWINTTDLLLEDPPIAMVEDYYQIRLEFSASKGAALDYTAYFNYSVEDTAGITNDTHYGIDCLTCHGHSHEVRNPYCTECHTEMELTEEDPHYDKMFEPEWQTRDHTAYYEESGLGNDFAVNPAVAQAFVVYGTIDVVRVDLRFNRTNTTPTTPDDNITVGIKSSLTGADLINTSVNSTDIITDGNWTSFNFTAPTRLNSSQTYYVVINRTGDVNWTDYMSVYVGTTSLYDDGNFWNWTTGGWEENESIDADFGIYHDTSCTDCHGGKEREPVFQVPTCDKCHNQTATGVLNTNTDIPPYGLKDVVHGRANWSCGEAGQCHGERHNKTTVRCEDCHNIRFNSSWNGSAHAGNLSEPPGFDNYTIESHAFNGSDNGWGVGNEYGATCIQCHDNATVTITGNTSYDPSDPAPYIGDRNMQTMIHATNGSYMSRDNCTVVCHWKNVSGDPYPYNSSNHKSGADNNCSQCHYRPNTNYIPAYHSREITTTSLQLWVTPNKTENVENDEVIQVNVTVHNNGTGTYTNVSLVGDDLEKTWSDDGDYNCWNTSQKSGIDLSSGQTINITFDCQALGSSGYTIFYAQANSTTDLSNVYESEKVYMAVVPEFPLGLVLPIIAPALIYLAMRRKIKLG